MGEVDKLKSASKEWSDEYSVPLVNAKVGDNGVMYWAKSGDYETHENAISVIADGAIATGLVYAQKRETGIYSHSFMVALKNGLRDHNTNLYLASALQKVLYNKYSREYLATWGKVQNDYVQLPINKNGGPDFEYMTEYIHQLELERLEQIKQEAIERLSAMCHVADVDNYELTTEEHTILNHQPVCGEFRLGGENGLFKISNNPQLDKENFTFSKHAKYPYFTRTVKNNGLLGYVEFLNDKNLIRGNSIAVGMLQMQFFYMNHDFYAGQFTKTAHPTFEGFNREVALYFTTLLNKNSPRFLSVLVRDFEKMFNETVVLLPIVCERAGGGIPITNTCHHTLPFSKNKTSSNSSTTSTPDYKYMSAYIKAQQKLAIADVAGCFEKQIAATEFILIQHIGCPNPPAIG
ncbi:MAG: restriction endonuclease subunit S [Defluviitaleaceae bacterium]|nr:restriction endonuclease subunit S [Defluviitaleaceae bacterium]